jgi:hypothetical protein
LSTLDEAKFFHDNLQRLAIIYGVEPVSEPPVVHIGNYNAVGSMGSAYYFDAQRQFALDYWVQPPQQHIEIVMPVPIRILRCTDDSVAAIPGLRDTTSADADVAP